MTDAEIDTDLLEQATGGDHDALERLLMSHYDRLARRMARRIPAALRATVSEEDILQQTFMGAFDGIERFQPRGRFAFYRWLCTIAEHRLQDAIRAQHAAKRSGHRVEAGPDNDASVIADLIDVLATTSHTPSRSIARRDIEGAVREGLDAISQDHRRAIELRYFKGLPVAEVAVIMGRTERAIHNLCYKGLRELNTILGRSSKYLTKK